MKFLFLTLALFLPLSTAQANETLDPTGYWLTENERSVIKVEQCGDALCGHIHWIIQGGMQYDSKNPVERLQGQPMCGLEIVKDLKQSANNPNRYEGGKIYKADDGDIYSASLTMKSDAALTVRGYIGVSLFGKSQKWTRVSTSDYPACRKPS